MNIKVDKLPFKVIFSKLQIRNKTNDYLLLKICYLCLCAVVIALVSTIYLNKYIGIKEIYLIWICAINFAISGIYVITPTAVTKCFGQKNFTSIYGLLLLINVIFHYFYLNERENFMVSKFF